MRFVCLLLCGVGLSLALPTQVEGAHELAPQVGAGKEEIPTNMDDMQAMINGAMQETYKADLGENNEEQQSVDMKATMDRIAEKNALADEMMVEEKRDCVLEQWSKWTKCNKKCGGGEITRTRAIKVHDQNGGEACPDYDGLHESASCNPESCADQKMDLAKKSRHLTDEEREKETLYNNKVMRRAMQAPSVDRMMTELHHWIKKSVATSMVNVLAPGEETPTDEDEIQEPLRKAIAKNTVDSAMAGFEQGQEQQAKKEEKKEAPK